MKFLLSFSIFLLFNAFVYSQTQVTGKVTDPETKEELINATIVFYQNGVFQHGAVTDFNGNYYVQVEPGVYNVHCIYLGYVDLRIEGVVAKANTSTTLNLEMSEPVEIPPCFIHTEYLIRFFDHDPPEYESLQMSKNIRQNPSKNIREMAAMSAGVSIQ
ncbi:MAG: carboxypeptidase-like regulatory domain-containing protein [Bacteroidota bacterium]